MVSISLSLKSARLAHDASKSDVTGRGVSRLALSCGRAEAQAVIGSAEMRSAFHHLQMTALVRRLTMTAGFLGIMARCIGRGSPLPDVADHVVKPVTIWRESIDGRRAFVAVLGEVLERKSPLPGVGHESAFGICGIAPGIGRTLEPAARGVLPLDLARQCLARPRRIGRCVLVGDMDDGMVVPMRNRAVRTVGMTPVGAGHIGPPGAVVA